jgi:hypothetical protein
MKSKGKPRNPFVALAKFRKAGSHTKPQKSLRRQEKQALTKVAKQLPESWHKRISTESAFAMISANLIPMRLLYQN